MLKFNFDLDPSLVIDPTKITKIVSSKNFQNGQWQEKTKHKLFNEPEVKKWFIPVDFSYWSLQLITIVEPLTIIPPHDHTEPVFRLILDGSLELNNEHYEEGDWVIVPANFKYGIKTREGYKVISSYHLQCEECKWAALSKMPLGKIK